jgi:hypothetical protein
VELTTVHLPTVQSTAKLWFDAFRRLGGRGRRTVSSWAADRPNWSAQLDTPVGWRRHRLRTNCDGPGSVGRPQVSSRYREHVNARAWLSGLGFLSVLAAIALLAVLGARVLDDTDEVRTSPVDAARELDAAAGDDGPGAPAGGVVLPGSGVAGQAQCDTNRTMLERAAQVHLLTRGGPPADQQALVDAGLLAEPVPTHTLTVVGDEAVIAGTGACA